MQSTGGHIKNYVSNKLSRYKLIHVNVRKIWRLYRYVSWRIKCKLSAIIMSIKSDDTNNIIWIKKSDIVHSDMSELSIITGKESAIVDDREISVKIGRYGEVIFSDVDYRLVINKLLKTPNIPVKVNERHHRWKLFRNELLQYSKMQGGKLYQPAMHPDLFDIPAYHECEDRYQLIKNNLTINEGSLLDIGSYIGYFSHRFEDMGFKCVAVELIKENIYFLRKIKRASNKKFKVVNKDVLGCNDIIENKYDVCLALNIFHHFLKKKDVYLKFVSFLKKINIKELYLQTHTQNEPQMKNAYKNYSPEEFVSFVLETSRLNNYKYIGSVNKYIGSEKGERKLFKLY